MNNINKYKICNKDYKTQILIIKSTHGMHLLYSILKNLSLTKKTKIIAIQNSTHLNNIKMFKENISTVILWEIVSDYDWEEIDKFYKSVLSLHANNKIITVGTTKKCIIKKPISVRKLLSILYGHIQNKRYINEHVIFDYCARTLMQVTDGMIETLTEKEAELLRYLLENDIFSIKNANLNKEEILLKIWRYKKEIDTTTFEVHIYRLHLKLLKFAIQI